MRLKFVLAAMVTTTLAVTLTATVSSAANASTSNPITPGEVSSILSKVSAKDRNLVKNAEASSSINVSTNPAKGVAFSSPEGRTMMINLPNVSPTSNYRGIKAKNGIIAYGGSNGSASAIVPMNNGVQFLTVIKNRKAPDEYTYPVALPEGGRIVTAPRGTGAAVIDLQGRVIAGIEAPWAKDSS